MLQREHGSTGKRKREKAGWAGLEGEGKEGKWGGKGARSGWREGKKREREEASRGGWAERGSPGDEPGDWAGGGCQMGESGEGTRAQSPEAIKDRERTERGEEDLKAPGVISCHLANASPCGSLKTLPVQF